MALKSAEEGCVAPDAEGLPRLGPALEDGEGSKIEANRSPLVAFAVKNRDRGPSLIDILRTKRERLADPEAAPVEEREQRLVPDPGRSTRRTTPKERASLLGGEHLGREAPSRP